ncbi:MAG TPA: tetratricopeptide repeat protein [Bryobacterales bacterium]|nr:tetratricopeptide repeat protein [Bryobacterales bacterium]
MSRIFVFLLAIAAAAPSVCPAAPQSTAPPRPVPAAPGAAPAGPAGEQGQLDSDITLFTVLAAINVAGYGDGLDSSAGSPTRLAVRKDLQSFHGPSLEMLKNVYQQRKIADSAQNLAQYISFSLQCAGPPDFHFRVPFTQVSPDAQPLHGLPRVLQDFYQQADIPKLFARYQPDYEKEIERYHDPVTQAVWEANGYLRIPTSGYLGRRFQIYIDLLSAPGNPSVRGYGPDVFVVVHPSRELRTKEIRHAYLHYLLDPFSSKYAAAIDAKKDLAGLAMFAPALDDSYKTDFSLLVTECLIKAIEARMKYGSEKQKQAGVEQALREGYILTPHFYEQLLRYEVQLQGIRFYYPEMVNAIDKRREDARLRHVSFLERPPQPQPRVEPAPPPLTGVAKTLGDAEDSFRRHQIGQAKKLFLQAQQESGGHDARALYGLARVAALEKDPERAKELFRQALEASPDPHVQAMSHIYLGRIEDLFGDREQAVAHYKEALACGDATPGTREAAEKGLKESFASPKPK